MSEWPLSFATLHVSIHGSARDREIIRDGEHRADCAESILSGPLDFGKTGDKSYEGKNF